MGTRGSLCHRWGGLQYSGYLLKRGSYYLFVGLFYGSPMFVKPILFIYLHVCIYIYIYIYISFIGMVKGIYHGYIASAGAF